MSTAVLVESEETFWKDGFEPLVIELTTDRIRSLGKTARGKEFTTEEAKAFLLLYREQLEGEITATVRGFIKKKLWPAIRSNCARCTPS
jgi:hypothetical protein